MQNYSAPMRAALNAAAFSPDPSTQNGAVIIDSMGAVLSYGYNHFPGGVEYRDERWERPAKYQYIEHAERDAIYAMARQGTTTMHKTMVCVWAACSDCARAIAMSGITKLVRYAMPEASHWQEEVAVGDSILREASVEIIEQYFSDISTADYPPILRNGQFWTPPKEDDVLNNASS